MREQDFDPMNELELSELMGELPPDDEMVKHITPWRAATDRIITGLGLTTITLNFLWLNYLLPLLGTVMLFLGFRSLRKENKWFFLCYVISIFPRSPFAQHLERAGEHAIRVLRGALFPRERFVERRRNQRRAAHAEQQRQRAYHAERDF